MGTCGRSDGEQEQDVAAISEDWEVRFRVNSDEASRHDHQRDSEDKSEEEMGGSNRAVRDSSVAFVSSPVHTYFRAFGDGR